MNEEIQEKLSRAKRIIRRAAANARSCDRSWEDVNWILTQCPQLWPEDDSLFKAACQLDRDYLRSWVDQYYPAAQKQSFFT